MKYRRNKYCTTIPKPSGEDWLSIGDVLLWSPKNQVCANGKFSLTCNLDVSLNGEGWAIARSALNFLLQSFYQGATEYQIDWPNNDILQRHPRGVPILHSSYCYGGWDGGLGYKKSVGNNFSEADKIPKRFLMKSLVYIFRRDAMNKEVKNEKIIWS